MPIFNENRKLDLYFIIIAFLATIYFTFVKCTHTRMYILETNDYASNLIRQNLRFIRKFTRSFPGCYRKEKKNNRCVSTSHALKACSLLQSMPKSGNSYWCSSAISLTPQLIKSVSFADNCCKKNRSAGR